jgi:nucleoid DNA-binding protein
MDIAKYIGLFLLKNQFCYVHGLGNLELHKRSATHDGKVLNGPSYEVVVTPGGSIDDNLANFIAVNEQISISKAANALRDYSIQARKDMAIGKEVAIPNMGKFVEESGRVTFVTDDNFRFTPAGVPTIKNSKQLEEQNAKSAHKPSYPLPQKADSVNWTMVIIVAVLLIIIGGGGYGIYYYMHSGGNQAPVLAVPDTTVRVQTQPMPDTTHLLTDTTNVVTAPAPVDSMKVNAYKMVIGDYATKEKADRRFKNLTMIGNHVEVVQKDSSNYLIISTINCRSMDTVHVIDSLRALFGYKKVRLYE